MKKSRSMRSLSPMLPLALAVAVQAIFSSVVSAGETIVFPADPVADINFTADSFAPSGSNTGKSTYLSGNSVTVNGPGTVQIVYGAININDTDEVKDNQVFITNNGNVQIGGFGGYSEDGNVTNNTLTVGSGSYVFGDAIGGYSAHGESVSRNTVNVNSGGTVSSFVAGGESNSGGVTNNIVNINGGVAQSHAAGGLNYSGYATNNTITVENGGIVYANAYGGVTLISGNASDNTVNINSGGTVYSFVHGGSSIGDDATNNTVNISGGKVLQSVYGGHSYGGFSNDNSGDATNNTVNISSGIVRQSVYGGYSYCNDGGGDSGAATGNTVILSGGSVGGDVYGGYSYSSGSSGDAFTGNTLNVKAAGLSVGGDLRNFQYLNFYVPTAAAANTTLLTVGGEANLTDGAGGSSIVNVAIAGGSTPLTTGDSITLIDAGTLTTASGLNTTANGQGMQGISLQYEFDIVADTASNKLLATVTSAEVPVQTKAISEGRAAGAGFVTQGAEMLTGVGMQSMQSASASNSNAAFGAIQGSSQRIKTGSHVDVDSFSLLAGAAVHNAFNQPNLSMGVFFEAGWGNYDSYNSFSNAASVHGDGDTNYYGVGLMGKLGLANDFYVDGSLRIGRVETDFNSGDFVKTYGQSISYDSKSTYTGASIGLGKIIKLDEQKNLDLYTRYLWTHVNSDSVKIVGDTYDFDAVNSHRLRAGVRFTQQYSPTSSFFAGAAYDYEFDGDAKGSVHGYRLDTPSLGGGTGIFEVGMTLRPQNNDRLSVDVGLQGYVGQREGVSGGVKVNYAF